MRCGLLAVGMALGVVSGCGSQDAFACQSDADCGPDGICGVDGYCAFSDAACPSGQRYGDYAPPSVAGQCVPSMLPTSTSETSDDTSATTQAMTTTTTSSGSLTGNESTTTTVTSTASGDATTTGSATAESTGSAMVVHAYEAVVVECIHETVLDPALCGSEGTVDVDLVDSSQSQAAAAFIRFDIDDAFAGARVVSVTLTLTTGTNDTSGQTGEIWTVEPFDFGGAISAWPAQNSMVGADQGATGVTQSVTWDLDPQAVPPDSSVHLGVFPIDDDGVQYMRASTVLPPTIEVVTSP